MKFLTYQTYLQYETARVSLLKIHETLPIVNVIITRLSDGLIMDEYGPFHLNQIPPFTDLLPDYSEDLYKASFVPTTYLCLDDLQVHFLVDRYMLLVCALLNIPQTFFSNTARKVVNHPDYKGSNEPLTEELWNILYADAIKLANSKYDESADVHLIKD